MTKIILSDYIFLNKNKYKKLNSSIYSNYFNFCIEKVVIDNVLSYNIEKYHASLYIIDKTYDIKFTFILEEYTSCKKYESSYVISKSQINNLINEINNIFHDCILYVIRFAIGELMSFDSTNIDSFIKSNLCTFINDTINDIYNIGNINKLTYIGTDKIENAKYTVPQNLDALLDYVNNFLRQKPIVSYFVKNNDGPTVVKKEKINDKKLEEKMNSKDIKIDMVSKVRRITKRGLFDLTNKNADHQNQAIHYVNYCIDDDDCSIEYITDRKRFVTLIIERGGELKGEKISATSICNLEEGDVFNFSLGLWICLVRIYKDIRKNETK